MFRFFSLFSAFRQSRTTNATNQSLAIINGALNLSSTPMSNILINGNANLGKKNEETIFSKLLVVNGNLNSQDVSFETLEVNGNSELNSCIITHNGEFFGAAKFTNCKLSKLDLRGNNFILRDCTVNGDIIVRAIMGKGKLILDNTIVEGEAKFTTGNGEIIVQNGASIRNP